MHIATHQDLEAAEKALASTLRKNEKAHATLVSKEARAWQIQMVAENTENFRTMLTVVANALRPDQACRVDSERADAALEAIPGYIGQIEQLLPKFRPGTSQHTLAIRRIAAYQTAAELLRQPASPSPQGSQSTPSPTTFQEVIL